MGQGLQASQVGLEDLVVAGQGEDQCHVDAAAFADHRLDGGDARGGCGVDADLFKRRGYIYNSLGDRRRAMADIETAISMDPKDAELFIGRGILKLCRLRIRSCAADLWHAWKLL